MRNLDITVSINDQEFETDLYCKLTDCHQSFEFNSAHPTQNNKNWLCIAKGCSLKYCVPKKMHLKITLNVDVLVLTCAVIPRNLLTIRLGGFLKQSKVAIWTSHKDWDLCTTCCDVSSSISYLHNTIRKPFIYLYAEKQFKKAFKPVPFLSFRSSYSLKNHLVCEKVPLLIREKGPSCCRKSRCETCINIQETDTFQSFVTKEVYKINNHFHSDSKCVIYLISLKVGGLQHFWSTVEWNRWVELLYVFTKDCVRWYSQTKLLPSAFSEWEPSTWETTWGLWDKANRQNWSLWSN